MKYTSIMASAVCALAMAPMAWAQSASYTPPKTSWGVPDFQGFWSTQSFTTMQRPEDVKELVLTQEKLDDLVYHNRYTAAERQEAGASKLDKASSDKLLADKNPSRGYNRFWMDPGSTYARVKGEFRSSWITFPDNGRMVRPGVLVEGGAEIPARGPSAAERDAFAAPLPVHAPADGERCGRLFDPPGRLVAVAALRRIGRS